MEEAQLQLGSLTPPAINDYVVSATASGSINTPLYTQPNIFWNSAGHSGYNTGGNVATALETVNNGAFTFTSC